MEGRRLAYKDPITRHVTEVKLSKNSAQTSYGISLWSLPHQIGSLHQ